MKEMKYLFFDVECANCFEGIGKICEFGYVLTDEKFNVIRADDIPMSPGRGGRNRFYLKGRKNERDLELAYDHSYYLSLPEFPKFYEQIKALMEDKDTICFAYSMNNDIKHIANTCKRYCLEPLDYICYDIQKLAIKYLRQKNQISLHKACMRIVGPTLTIKLQEHLSRDDAKMEMMIFDAVCELMGKTSTEVLNELEFAKVNSVEFLEKISTHENRKRLNSKGHELCLSLSVSREELDNSNYVGKRYNFSGALKAHYNELLIAIDYVKQHNGVLCNNLSKTDFFVVYNQANKEEILNVFKRPFDGKIIIYDELINGGN